MKTFVLYSLPRGGASLFVPALSAAFPTLNVSAVEALHPPNPTKIDADYHLVLIPDPGPWAKRFAVFLGAHHTEGVWHTADIGNAWTQYVNNVATSAVLTPHLCDRTTVTQLAEAFQLPAPGPWMPPTLTEEAWEFTPWAQDRFWDAFEENTGLHASIKVTPDAIFEPKTRIVAACVVKNEAENIEALYESAREFVDEWVMLDTGSTDETVKIMRRLGMLVIEDPWRDDFAYSRNLVMDEARREYPDVEWLVYLDGDDRVVNGAVWRAALLNDVDSPFAFVRVDSPTHYGTVEASTQARALRASEQIGFLYPVHAVPDLGRYVALLSGKVKAPTVRSAHVLHVGYQTEAEMTNNVDRTLRILREKMPADDPHRQFYEGRALVAQGKWDEALPIFAALIKGVKPGGPRPTTAAYGLYANALLRTAATLDGGEQLQNYALAAAVLAKGLHERHAVALGRVVALGAHRARS